MKGSGISRPGDDRRERIHEAVWNAADFQTRQAPRRRLIIDLGDATAGCHQVRRQATGNL